MKQPDAIICSDLHLMDTTPVCRTDDFMQAQADKYKFLRKLQEEYNVPILVSGDIFNHWKPSPFLLGWALRNLPDNIVCIPGQHDLPAHNLGNVERSGIQVLADAGKVELLLSPDDVLCEAKSYIQGFPWGCDLVQATHPRSPSIALIHRMVYKGTPPFPGAENCGGTGTQTIRKLPGFKLIVSGDNHQTFVEEVNGQVLINPGSFMRTTAAQVDHKPCVFLWRANDNAVEQVFLPINKNVISREHIDKVQERDERIHAFVSKLPKVIATDICFKANMERYIIKNRIPKTIADIIWRVMK